MKKLFLLALVLLSFVQFSSCSSDLHKVNISNTQLSLLSLTGKTLTLVNKELEQEKKIYMTIIQHKMSGFAGCNHFTAALTSNEQTFKAGQIALTRKYCTLPISNDNPQQIMQTEALFLDLLRTANRYIVKNNQLSLFDDNKLLLQFAITNNK